jgi:LysR family glycine cleavage system transcriptional activator
MRRLPPLTAIEAFVQVARLGSIKAAAEELALSSPALSRRVQALERFIGRPLFERRHQALKLNADGERLLGLIAPTLDAMTDAIEAMTSGADVLRLRLSVLPLYASQRLMPHLGDLKRRHPQLHLDIDTAGYGIARLGESLDAAIVLTRDVDPSLYSVKLEQSRVVAIGARSLVEGSNPVTRPAQIADMTVLIHRDLNENFTAWRDAAGIPDVEPLAIDHFDSGALMLEAAAQGFGVAFLLESLLEEANDDRLVPLFDVQVESPYSYWFVCRPRALQTKPVKIFHDWLVQTLGTAG